MLSKSFFSNFSRCSSCPSVAALISRLKWTVPGTVFTLPGLRDRIPVLASAEQLDAIRRELIIILAEASRASARLAKSVVPV